MSKVVDFKVYDKGEDVTHYYSTLKEYQTLVDWIDNNIDKLSKKERDVFISVGDIRDAVKKDTNYVYDNDEISLAMVCKSLPYYLSDDILFRAKWKN